MTKVIRQVQDIRSFFYSQAFADGVRATFAILLPALLGSYFGTFDAGLSISLGAMCVSLTDAPGPFKHKRNGMLACAAFIFAVAFITGFARLSTFAMAAEIGIVCFFFSMFNVYGNRAAAVGNAAILIMILTMDKPLPPSQALSNSLLIFCGGIYYTALSLLLYKLQPYRIARRALGDCIREIANYLSVKADFYNTATDLSADYKKMLATQIAVHEKQDAARELLFKSREIVEESTVEGRRLVLTFTEAVDLFENITATYYDYDLLRKQYASTGVLNKISFSLKKISLELNRIGVAIQSGSRVSKTFNYDDELITLKQEIDSLDAQGIPTRVLKRILVNIRRILQNIQLIAEYLASTELPKTTVDHSRFLSHQTFTVKMFWDNFSLHSSVFRHSLRVAVACLAGFLVAKVLSYGHNSYWILLTIAFILKPAYSLTRQRNVERILGTLAGAAIGIAIFVFVHDSKVHFLLMVMFMIGTYSFMRLNYLRMVVCTTPYVLLLFNFLGLSFIELAGERVLDTVIGCSIAFAANAFILPSWEADQLQEHMKKMLQANINYLAKVINLLQGKKVHTIDYKLARKEVYVASANLTAAFQRMLSEPKSRQAGRKDIYQFVVQSHTLFSNIASVATMLLRKEPRKYSDEILLPVRKTYHQLNEALSIVDKSATEDMHIPASEVVYTVEEKPLKEQLSFIEKLSADMKKTTEKIIE